MRARGVEKCSIGGINEEAACEWNWRASTLFSVFFNSILGPGQVNVANTACVMSVRSSCSRFVQEVALDSQVTFLNHLKPMLSRRSRCLSLARQQLVEWKPMKRGLDGTPEG